MQKLKEAVQHVPGGKIENAFDCVSEKGSYQNICQVLDHKTGKITLILPGREYSEIPESIEKSITKVAASFPATDEEPWQKKTGALTGNQEFAHLFYRYVGRGLQKGFFKGHPYEVFPGGLAGIEGALTNLKEGKASAVKYVFRLEDTEGVERWSTN